MKLVNEINNLKSKSIGITIGSFDGIHLGHNYLLSNFKQKCGKLSITPVVITFAPHPLIYIQNKENHLLLNSKNKIKILKEYGLEVIEIKFDSELQKLSGEQFFTDLLKELPNIKMVFCGHDFGLGDKKSLNYNQLKSFLVNIDVIQDEAFNIEKQKISSTLIREQVVAGDVEKAKKYLNRPFSLIGKIVKGNQIGREIGFPTANLSISPEYLIPANGVYVAEVWLDAQMSYLGVVNIGYRPTVTNDNTSTVEVHIINFDDDIYSRNIKIDFHSKLRDEIKFESKEELISQIKTDLIEASGYDIYNKFALIGKNISHSKSKSVYSSLLKTNLLSYSLLDYESEFDLPNLKDLAQKYKQISVTAPYKKFIYTKMDIVSKQIKEYESVNCFKLVNGKLVGTNTDLLAIDEILSELIKNNFQKILVLGNGSMSKIVQSLLNKYEFKFEVLSRKNNKLNFLNESIQENSLIINTCLREYSPNIDTNFNISFWDLNYNQPYKDKMISTKNLNYFDGNRMLMLQAKYALSFWNLKTL